jgi:hypothetical protein
MRYASASTFYLIHVPLTELWSLLRLRLLDLADVDELGLERGATDEEPVDVGSLGWGKSAWDIYKDRVYYKTELPLRLGIGQRSSRADVLGGDEWKVIEPQINSPSSLEFLPLTLPP